MKLRDLLERIGSLFRTEQRNAGAGSQMQPVHQDVLHYLARCNRYSNTPAAVTEYLQITKGTVSQSIQVLERRGLVLKQPDTRDGRIVRLRLSARGRRLADRLRTSATWDQLTDTIGACELSTAERVLTRILYTLQERNSFQSFGQCDTCRHFRQQENTTFHCGLTGESLQLTETRQICREHDAGEAMLV